MASLLHLGNVTYKATLIDNIDATEVVAMDCLQKTARLLEVSWTKPYLINLDGV